MKKPNPTGTQHPKAKTFNDLILEAFDGLDIDPQKIDDLAEIRARRAQQRWQREQIERAGRKRL